MLSDACSRLSCRDITAPTDRAQAAIAALKAEVAAEGSTPFVRLLEEYVLSNRHRVTLSLVPEPSLGAALLDVSAKRAPPSSHRGAAAGGTFARREASDAHRMHAAADRIQKLARKRSLKQMRMAAVHKGL